MTTVYTRSAGAWVPYGGTVVAPVVTPPAAGSIAWGWDVTPSNVGLVGAGVDRTTLATYSGTPTAGQTITLKKITSALDLGGFNNGNFNGPKIGNVTFDRCWFASGANRAIIPGPGTVIKDCEIDGTTGSQTTDNITIYGNLDNGESVTIQRCYIHGGSVAAWLDGAGSYTVTDSYLQASTTGTAHVDGFTRRSGIGPITFSRCHIVTLGQSVTGAFFLQPTFGVENINGGTISDSLLESAGYVFTLENKSGGTATTLGVSNCRATSTEYGYVTKTGTVTQSPWTLFAYDSANPTNATDGGRRGTGIAA